MAELTGHVAVVLTVNDAERSADWYAHVLGFAEVSRYVEPDGVLGQVTLVEPKSQLTICLVRHADGTDGRLDERHIGLDHLEFLVDQRVDLDGWEARLDAAGVPHSGIKTPDYARTAMLTFRDPDNIQLEFFWAGPAAPVRQGLG